MASRALNTMYVNVLVFIKLTFSIQIPHEREERLELGHLRYSSVVKKVLLARL